MGERIVRVYADHAEPGSKMVAECAGPDAQTNAELIAAAPELLDTCLRVVAWLDRLAISADSQAQSTQFTTMKDACESDAKNYRATAADIRRAIAKAQGGAQ